MPHQAIGVSWMIEKENSSSKGGCLADEMGLGKASPIFLFPSPKSLTSRRYGTHHVSRQYKCMCFSLSQSSLKLTNGIA